MSAFGQTEENVEAEKEVPSCFGDYGDYFDCDGGCVWSDECLHASEEDDEEDEEDDDDYESEEDDEYS